EGISEPEENELCRTFEYARAMALAAGVVGHEHGPGPPTPDVSAGPFDPHAPREYDDHVPTPADVPLLIQALRQIHDHPARREGARHMIGVPELIHVGLRKRNVELLEARPSLRRLYEPNDPHRSSSCRHEGSGSWDEMEYFAAGGEA